MKLTVFEELQKAIAKGNAPDTMFGNIDPTTRWFDDMIFIEASEIRDWIDAMPDDTLEKDGSPDGWTSYHYKRCMIPTNNVWIESNAAIPDPDDFSKTLKVGIAQHIILLNSDSILFPIINPEDLPDDERIEYTAVMYIHFKTEGVPINTLNWAALIMWDKHGFILDDVEGQRPGQFSLFELRDYVQDFAYFRNYYATPPEATASNIPIALWALSHMCNRGEVIEAKPSRQWRRRVKRSSRDNVDVDRIWWMSVGSNRKQYVKPSTRIVPVSETGRAVRGHFKYFAEERPLFGKYSGLYWWGPQGEDEMKKIGYRIRKNE